MGSFMSRASVSLAFLCIAMMPEISQAGLLIQTGNPPGSFTNVGDFEATSSTTAVGEFLGQNDDILVVTTNVALVVGGSGSANINAVSTEFTSFEITPFAIGFGFTGLAFNFDDGPGPVPDAEITINAFDQFGLAASGTFDLNNGNNNRYFVTPIDATQLITKVTVTATGPVIQSIQNVRVLDVAVIPEPSTLTMAAMAGLSAGFAGLRSWRRGRVTKE